MNKLQTFGLAIALGLEKVWRTVTGKPDNTVDVKPPKREPKKRPLPSRQAKGKTWAEHDRDYLSDSES